MTSFTMIGLEGPNFQGFMAALGVLRLLHDGAVAGRCPWSNPRLSWTDGGSAACIHVDTRAGATDPTEADLSTWLADELIRRWSSLHFENMPAKVKNMPLALYRSLMIDSVERGDDLRRDFLMAVCTDMAANTSEPDAVNQSPLVLQGGNMQFFGGLAQHMELFARAPKKGDPADPVSRMQASLFGPWLRNTRLGGLRWDPGEIQDAASLSENPSKNGAWSETPGVLLAAVGWTLTPCLGSGERAMVALRHRRTLVWPLWIVPASLPTVKTLLTLTPAPRRTSRDDPGEPDPTDPRLRELAARGAPMMAHSVVFEIGQYPTNGPGQVTQI